MRLKKFWVGIREIIFSDQEKNNIDFEGEGWRERERERERERMISG